MEAFFNRLMLFFLRSPLGRGLNKLILALTVTGRRSGKTFTFPVSYAREGETLTVITSRRGQWWRNLLGGASMRVYVDGRERPATGEAIAEAGPVTEALIPYLRQVPGNAKFFGVALDDARQPVAESAASAAERLVYVRIRLEEVL